MATFPSDTLPSLHFNDLISRDEALMSHVCPYPKVFLSHEDTLEQADDTYKISLHNTLCTIHFNDIHSRDVVLIKHTCPSPKVDPIHEDVLV